MPALDAESRWAAASSAREPGCSGVRFPYESVAWPRPRDKTLRESSSHPSHGACPFIC